MIVCVSVCVYVKQFPLKKKFPKTKGKKWKEEKVGDEDENIKKEKKRAFNIIIIDFSGLLWLSFAV